MMNYRFGLIALVLFAASTVGAGPARAASYQLCLALDGETGNYFMNFAVQGNAVLVTGYRGHGGQDDHGPLFGALSHAPETPQYLELGLTVTLSNGGDYSNQNTENVVFRFFQNGVITYKRWLHSSKAFTEGTVSLITCH
jgi:hypothetical protein